MAYFLMEMLNQENRNQVCPIITVYILHNGTEKL